MSQGWREQCLSFPTSRRWPLPPRPGAGHRVERIDMAAISALKTFDQPMESAQWADDHRRRPARQFMDIELDAW